MADNDNQDFNTPEGGFLLPTLLVVVYSIQFRCGISGSRGAPEQALLPPKIFASLSLMSLLICAKRWRAISRALFPLLPQFEYSPSSLPAAGTGTVRDPAREFPFPTFPIPLQLLAPLEFPSPSPTAFLAELLIPLVPAPVGVSWWWWASEGVPPEENAIGSPVVLY